MEFRPTTLERAFELAKSGECAGVSEIKARLHREGYTISQVEGPVLVRQLNALCHEAQADLPEEGPGEAG